MQCSASSSDISKLCALLHITSEDDTERRQIVQDHLHKQVMDVFESLGGKN